MSAKLRTILRYIGSCDGDMAILDIQIVSASLSQIERGERLGDAKLHMQRTRCGPLATIRSYTVSGVPAQAASQRQRQRGSRIRQGPPPNQHRSSSSPQNPRSASRSTSDLQTEPTH